LAASEPGNISGLFSGGRSTGHVVISVRQQKEWLAPKQLAVTWSQPVSISRDADYVLSAISRSVISGKLQTRRAAAGVTTSVLHVEEAQLVCSGPNNQTYLPRLAAVRFELRAACVCFVKVKPRICPSGLISATAGRLC
jgi:hypothetical protein